MDPNKIPMTSEKSEEVKIVPELGKLPEAVRSKEEQEDFEKACIEIIKAG